MKNCKQYFSIFAKTHRSHKNQLHAIGLLIIRCLIVSTNQAHPIHFYFRISWIFMEQHWLHFFLSLSFSARPWKPPTLTASNIKYEKFWSDSSLKNRYSCALIFQERGFFDHYIYNFKNFMTPKISFGTTNILNLMIKKRPLAFSKLKK